VTTASDALIAGIKEVAEDEQSIEEGLDCEDGQVWCAAKTMSLIVK
jgi:hypothetical protein